MGRDLTHRLGQLIVYVGFICAGLITLVPGRHAQPWVIAWWYFLALVVAAFAHQAAHAFAVHLIGERVLAIEVGTLGTLARFEIGSVPVRLHLILFYGGRVVFRGRQLPVQRQIAIAAAGPAANVLLAACCLALPLQPLWRIYIAVMVLAFGLLDSGREGDLGILADGFVLLRARARLRCEAEIQRLLADPGWYDRPDAFTRLVEGYRLDLPGARDLADQAKGNPDVLLALCAQQWPLPDKPDFHDVMVVLILSSSFAEMVDVPGDIADLAAERIEWAIACIDKEYPEESEISAKWLMTHLIPEYSSLREVAELSRTALAETRLRHGSASLPLSRLWHPPLRAGGQLPVSR
jgi:hypothetical protein